MSAIGDVDRENDEYGTSIQFGEADLGLNRVHRSVPATMDAGGDYSFECTVLWIIGVAVAVLEALGTAVSYDEQRYTDWRFRLANDMPTASEWLVCHLSSLRAAIAFSCIAVQPAKLKNRSRQCNGRL